MALMAPVRLRSVASGLSIEKVRSIAIGSSFTESNRKVYGVSLEKSGRALIPVGLSDGKIGRPEAWAGVQHAGPISDVRRLQCMVQRTTISGSCVWRVALKMNASAITDFERG
jgi:hypothetical protein